MCQNFKIHPETLKSASILTIGYIIGDHFSQSSRLHKTPLLLGIVQDKYLGNRDGESFLIHRKMIPFPKFFFLNTTC